MAAHHHRRDLALGGLQRHHHPRRPAIDPRGRLRGGHARSRQQVQAILLHHLAAAASRSSSFCIVLSIIGTMQLFAEPFLITKRGGPGGGTETLGLLLYRQGFTVAQFRLCLGGRLHDGRPGDRHLAAAICGWRGSGHEQSRLGKPRAAASCCTVPDAAGADLAVSAVDDGGVLDHAGPRHLQPRASRCCRTAISSTTSTTFSAIPISSAPSSSRSSWRLTYTFLSVLLTSMAGWALARYQFFGKGGGRGDHPRHHHPALLRRRHPAIHHGGARLPSRQHLGRADRAAAVQLARRAVHAPELSR